MVVKTEFEKLGLKPTSIELGIVTLPDIAVSAEKFTGLATALNKHGFELLTDKKEQLVAKIKGNIVALVHDPELTHSANLSVFLSEELKVSYHQLSAAFSEVTGTTIEQFYILQKIEKAKELLSYGDLSLSEISYRLNYSSVAHLSAQFKRVTGETASAYRTSKIQDRKTLDKI